MTDPYRQHPNPYGQQPGRQGPNPPGGPQNPYGQHPDPYPPGGQNPYGQHPDPYPSGGDRQDQPDPDATQVLPYGGQYSPGQPHQYGQRPDPHQTRQFEPGPFPPGAPGAPGDQYGHYQGSYGQPPAWGQGGGRPPGPPRKPRPPMLLFTVLVVLVIVAGVITVVLLAGGDNSTPAAHTTAAAAPSSASSAQPETPSRKAQASTTTQPPTTTSSASGKTFEAGQCATLTPQPGNRATLNEALCGASNSDVIVAVVQDRDCVKDYITFNADVGKVYCLALDAEEGACFRFDQLVKRAPNCPAGTHKVAKIFENVTDSGRCDQVQGVDRRYAYPKPARTICLVPAA